MALNPRIWFPIAVVLAVVNAGAMWVVGRALPADPRHVMLHAILAVASIGWAVHLRSRQRGSTLEGSRDADIAELRGDVETLREEVRVLEERLDFAERLLSQAREWTPLPERKQEESPGQG